MPDQEIVYVRHPYRMELRRKRKRSREQWWVAADTPVTLRTVDPAEFGPAVVAPGHGDRPPLTWRSHGGDLWYGVAGVRLDRGGSLLTDAVDAPTNRHLVCLTVGASTASVQFAPTEPPGVRQVPRRPGARRRAVGD